MKIAHTIVRLAAINAGTLLLAGCSENRPPVADPAVADQQSPAVRVQTVAAVEQPILRQTTQPATVHAWYEAEIHARVPGYMQELKVDIGDAVEADAELAVLAVPDLQRQQESRQKSVEQLQAVEKRAKAEVALAQANLKSSSASLVQAQAETLGAKAQFTANQSELTRIADLVKSGSLQSRLQDESQQRFGAAEASVASAEAGVNAAEANVNVYEARLAAAEAQLAVAQAETEVARKELEFLNEQVKFATLRAPFKGTITERNVDPGELVRNSQTTGGERTPLFRIANLDTVRVRIAVPENEAPWTNVGDKVTLRLRAFADAPIEAAVSRIASALDGSTRTMLVEVDVPNPDHRILPGMYGEATIDLDTKETALLLPAAAVQHSASQGSFAYVIDGDGMVQIAKLTIGYDNGKLIEVLDGLPPAARVVHSVIGRLEAGQRVQID